MTPVLELRKANSRAGPMLAVSDNPSVSPKDCRRVEGGGRHLGRRQRTASSTTVGSETVSSERTGHATTAGGKSPTAVKAGRSTGGSCSGCSWRYASVDGGDVRSKSVC